MAPHQEDSKTVDVNDDGVPAAPDHTDAPPQSAPQSAAATVKAVAPPRPQHKQVSFEENIKIPKGGDDEEGSFNPFDSDVDSHIDEEALEINESSESRSPGGEKKKNTHKSSSFGASIKSRVRKSKISSGEKRNNKRYRNNDSMILPNEAHASENEDLLKRAVRQAGLYAFGAVFVECWVLSTNGKRLTRPPGGAWMDPSLIQSIDDPTIALDIEETASQVGVGEGLVGTLYNQSSIKLSREVQWRQIQSVLNDPFVAKSKVNRMKVLLELGIGITATCTFRFQERNGIVIFMSRTSADIEKLRASANEKYIVGATDLIGAAFAIRIPQMECARLRRQQFVAAVHKVRAQMLSENFTSLVKQASCIGFKGNDNEGEEFEPDPNMSQLLPKAMARRYFEYVVAKSQTEFKKLVHLINNSRKKWRGSKLAAPARQSLRESTMVFVGVFLTMLTLVHTTDSIEANSDGQKWVFDAGWYASSLCISFALTPAPVGQPRQIVLGHVWCAFVGIMMQYIPTNIDRLWEDKHDEDLPMGLPLNLKQSMSVALGISGMAYIGIIHPPASGLCFTFASKPEWGWSSIIAIMVGDLVMIGMSVVYLNLIETKQYPMFWFGFEWWQMPHHRLYRWLYSEPPSEFDDDKE